MATLVTTFQFSVPTWEAPRRHDDLTEAWDGDPPPTLDAHVRYALQEGRLLYGLYHHKGQVNTAGNSLLHPYCIGGPTSTYYAYESEAGAMPDPGFGSKDMPAKRYGFFATPPESLDNYYEYDPEKTAFEIIVQQHTQQYALMMHVERITHVYITGTEFDTVETMMMRTTSIVHLLLGLKGDWRPEALPFDKDTQQIAHVKAAHILRWHFENSLSRPAKA